MIKSVDDMDVPSSLEQGMERPGAVQFVPKKTDEEAADEYRKRVESAIEVVNAIITEARRKRNFQIMFATGPDGAGIERITNLQIMKRL